MHGDGEFSKGRYSRALIGQGVFCKQLDQPIISLSLPQHPFFQPRLSSSAGNNTAGHELTTQQLELRIIILRDFIAAALLTKRKIGILELERLEKSGRFAFFFPHHNFVRFFFLFQSVTTEFVSL